MCFSFPLTIDWVPRQFLSLWASPSPFAPAASAWPRTRREGRGGGAVAVAGSRLPAYVRNESRAASPPGRDGAAQRDPAKSGSAPFRRGVSLSGCSGWRCLPPPPFSRPPSFRRWPLWGCDRHQDAVGERLALIPRAGTSRGSPGSRAWVGVRKGPGWV